MIRLLFSWAVAAILAVLLGGCTHYYYAPNQQNVPLFKEKDEVRLSGAWIHGDEISGCDVQAAYAVTKEAGIMANALVINPRSADGKGQMYEMGAGYYKPIPSKFSSVSRKFVFETYGVFGLGDSKNYYNNYPANVTTGLFKSYLQPSIGFTTNLFDIILSSKIGTLYTFDVRRNMPDSTYENLIQNGSTIASDFNVLSHSRLSFLFEPAVTFRIGFKYVKFHLQFGSSFLSTSMRNLTTAPVWDTGLTIFIAHRFWNRDERPQKDKWREIWD